MAGLREDPYASSLFTCVAVSVATQWATQGLALMSASIIVHPFASPVLVGSS